MIKNQINQILCEGEKLNKGLKSSETLISYLNELQSQNRVPKILVLFEVIGLKSAKIKKEISEYFYNAFKELLNTYELVAHWSEETYALVFKGFHPNFVQLFMRDFLSNIYDDIKKQYQIETPFYVYEGLTLLTNNENGFQALERCQIVLKSFKKKSKESLSLITDPKIESIKEVRFYGEFDDFPSLKRLFSKRDFHVIHKNDLEELPTFNTSINKSIPLFILAQSISERNKLKFIKQLCGESCVRVPMLYLSAMLKEEDLFRLLEGLNYFEAPFGFVICVCP